MALLAATLLLLAPAAREPVGAPGWRKIRHPVERRVSSLLAGAPHRRGFVTVVPLYARVPSEAGQSLPAPPLWVSPAVRARELREPNRFYLRVGNLGPRKLFVPAGAVFGLLGRELVVGRDALVNGEFAALLPASPNPLSSPTAFQGDMEFLGTLPPQATGLMLLERGGSGFSHLLRSYRQQLKQATLRELRRVLSVRKLRAELRKSCAPIPDEFGSTAVGAVFLIAGEPVAAHVFLSNSLFRDAVADLLGGLAIQARDYQYKLGPSAGSIFTQLARLAERSDEQAGAIAFLRGSFGRRERWTESYGEGFEMLAENERDRVVAHAVLDQRRAVVHFSLYALGYAWPGKPGGGSAGAGPTAPQPPGPGGSERSPGEIDRKARPTAAEKRWRDRRPGPGPTGGPRSNNGRAGGGGNSGRSGR